MTVFRTGIVAVLTFVLAACAGPAREPVKSVESLNNDEAIVVGRIELVPALRKDEQKIQVMNKGMFVNKVFVLTDDRDRKLTREPTVKDYTGRVEAMLGEHFFVRSRNQPFYIVGAMMYLNLGAGGGDQAYFPGGMKVSLRSGDKAVYIGTVQYHRNEFWEITKVAIVDEYDRANAEFKKRFGARHSLRKALLTRSS